MAPFITASSFESANVPPGNQRTSLAASTGMPCSCLLSSASRVLLFFNQPAIERPSHPALPFDAVRVHKLVSSAIDQCFRSVVEHPLLKPLMGLSTALTQAFQMPFQNSRYSARSQTSFHGLNFAAILPGDTVAGLVVANGLTNFLNIYNTLLVVRLLLTWFPNTPPAIVSPLSTLCDPYLNIFRGIIPPLGGTLDLSPILAFLVLNAFTSTASALPAELPPSGTSNRVPSLPHHWDLTTVQNKWLKRLVSKETKSQNGRGLQGNGS